jgi:predicted GNAT superfamily acetyltransferase
VSVAPKDGITIRRVVTTEEYDACVSMQHAIWGDDFTEIVPATMLRVTQKIGGVTAGAFDESGKLLGFVFGLMGAIDGKLVHWSDLLAVHPEARNKGLGRRLKLYQRELLLPQGVETMFWTYDPLVAKNAYLNIVRLGARPKEYVVNMYGSDTHSALHGGIGTDRFIVGWNLAIEGGANGATGAAVENPAWRELPIVDGRSSAELPEIDTALVEVPADIEEVIARDIGEAERLRESTRRVLTHYMERGYGVTGFSHRTPEDRYFYILSRNGAR